MLITECPKVVEELEHLGDFEVDLMIGKSNKLALPVLADLTTLLTALEKVISQQGLPTGSLNVWAGFHSPSSKR